MWKGEGTILSTGVSAGICRCSADSGAERDGFDTKLIQTGIKKAPKATKMEPKGSQSEARNF
jgi:hypothetical protein